jgi:alpha-amylase
VGNFDHVYKKAVDDCYFPFLKIVSEFTWFRFTVHFSGPLLEWMEKKRPDVISLIQNMVEEKQVELMAAGFYEPLLPFIPEGDAKDQIKYMTVYLEERFGTIPKGIWLSERIWDPSLPKLLGQLGIKYTLVDDTHFLNAGFSGNEIHGYYLTEKEGCPLAIFPISKALRYLIPFHPPRETIGYFKKFFSKAEGHTLTYGDDGEKFGIWPGTKKLVYQKGWLKSFLQTLEEEKNFLRIIPLGEYIEAFPPRGRAYLPPASYEEMMEWSLLPEKSSDYRELVDNLKEQGKWESYQPFIRGGAWENFLIKYEEANLMHKKMVYVSNKLTRMLGKYCSGPLHPARKELWKGQCNCAYWHGIFGGIYLNHLRSAVYHHLIVAGFTGENNQETLDIDDFDCDGQPEYLFSLPGFNAYFKPHYGGSLFELDLQQSGVNLLSVLKRRREAYHERIKQVEHDVENKEVKSIHDKFQAREQNLNKFLIYDRYMRYSFLDHLLDQKTTIDDFYQDRQFEYGNFANGQYQVKGAKEDELSLEREEKINGLSFAIEKTFVFGKSPPFIKANYTPSFSSPFLLATELNFNLMAKDDPKRYLLVKNERFGTTAFEEIRDIEKISVIDEEMGWQIKIVLGRPMALWSFPVETVNLSEEGAERSYQGTCLVFLRYIEGKGKDSICLYLEGD